MWLKYYLPSWLLATSQLYKLTNNRYHLTTSEPIKTKTAVQLDIILLENSASDAINPNTGIQSTWNVSLVMLVMSGTKIFTSAIAALLQDKSSEDNVLAQLQPLSGTETPVFAQPTLSDQTVFHALLQDSGTILSVNVFALKTESGTDKIAFALLDFMDQTVFHAQLQDSGITLSVNVFAHKTEFGTDKIVFVLQDFLDQTVNHAQLQEDG